MFERIAPEQHDTLDGIPEPAENARFYGHGEAAGMLAAAYRSGKLPHALLLVGPLGVGKATIAFHLAQTIQGAAHRAIAHAVGDHMDAHCS